jgi:hypothetical protein
VLAEGGKQIMQAFDDELIRITPRRIISWGVESDAFRPNSRSAE